MPKNFQKFSALRKLDYTVTQVQAQVRVNVRTFMITPAGNSYVRTFLKTLHQRATVYGTFKEFYLAGL